jgi:pimeloyl-ACP methyl ester carboxylesterase
MHEMPWMDSATFAPKLEQLLRLIDRLHEQGCAVSLVGASAGAGAVLNAFAARKDKVGGVVCLAGKINNPDTIGNAYRRRSPSFLESALEVQFSLDKLDVDTDRKRIMSRYAIFDGIVPRQDSILIGGINKAVPSLGHGVTIISQLLLGAPFYMGWLKTLAKQNR